MLRGFGSTVITEAQVCTHCVSEFRGIDCAGAEQTNMQPIRHACAMRRSYTHAMVIFRSLTAIARPERLRQAYKLYHDSSKTLEGRAPRVGAAGVWASA